MNLIDKLVARRDALQNEDGFSFLEMVIAGVLLGALAAGGVVGYGKVVQNGHKQALAGAVSQLEVAGFAALNDDPTRTLTSVINDFNGTTEADELAKKPLTAAADDSAKTITVTSKKVDAGSSADNVVSINLNR